jgi:hypothetical protein
MTDQRPWRPLYLTGGIAALLALFVFRRNLGAELTLFGLPAVPKVLPADAAGWFDLLQQHPLTGLTLLEVFDLAGLVFLALGVALWRVSRSAVLVATGAGLTGIVVYLASNPAFGLLALSSRYAVAETAQWHRPDLFHRPGARARAAGAPLRALRPLSRGVVLPHRLEVIQAALPPSLQGCGGCQQPHKEMPWNG